MFSAWVQDALSFIEASEVYFKPTWSRCNNSECEIWRVFKLWCSALWCRV